MTSNDEDADPGAETAVGPPCVEETELMAPTGAAGVWPEFRAGGDETELLAPATEVRIGAWSDEQREDQPVRDGQSWKQVGLIAAAIFVPLTALVVVIGLWLQQPRKPPAPEPSRAPQTTTAVASPPPTVTVPPPVTVTQIPPAAPPTVTVTPAPAAPPPAAERPPPDAGSPNIFTICPDGHEGVVGGHTTCAFAENVRQTFYATGQSNSFTAYSPVTGDGYEMTCVGRYPAYFTDGSTKVSTRCYGGDNAEVVIW